MGRRILYALMYAAAAVVDAVAIIFVAVFNGRPPETQGHWHINQEEQADSRQQPSDQSIDLPKPKTEHDDEGGPNDAQCAENDDQFSRRRPFASHQTWMAIGTLIMAAGTIALAIVSAFQFYSINSKSNTQLRAYVATSGGTASDLSADGEITISIFIKNLGQTPAYKLDGNLGIAYAWPDFRGPFLNEWITHGELGSLGRDSTWKFRALAKHCDPKILDQIKHNKYTLFVYGEVTYIDIFKAKHTTHFTFSLDTYVDGKAHLRHCENENDLRQFAVSRFFFTLRRPMPNQQRLKLHFGPRHTPRFRYWATVTDGIRGETVE